VEVEVGGTHQWAQAHFLVAPKFTRYSSGQVADVMGFELERVREIVERVAASNELEVVEVELYGSGKTQILRIFIDKPGGITHENCARLSREVGTILEVENTAPPGAYVLEVSSPGLDRKLVRPTDYERFAGSRVKLFLHQPVNGTKFFEGRLESFQNGKVILELGGSKKKSRSGRAESTNPESKKMEISFADIEKANLVPEFDF
jgi:ribosome maturation factor RimP